MNTKHKTGTGQTSREAATKSARAWTAVVLYRFPPGRDEPVSSVVQRPRGVKAVEDYRTPSRSASHKPAGNSAFTLIEIMIVCGIIALFMTVSVPFMRNAIDGGKGMTRAIKDVQEACSHARATAILQQTTTELIIRPRDGTFEVSIAGNDVAQHTTQMDSPDVAGNNWRMPERGAAKPAGGGIASSYKLPENVQIKGLGVNGEDWTDDPVARVRFRSNGTCDEMTIVLIDDKNQSRNIWLEVVTGLPELESDESKFKAR